MIASRVPLYCTFAWGVQIGGPDDETVNSSNSSIAPHKRASPSLTNTNSFRKDSVGRRTRCYASDEVLREEGGEYCQTQNLTISFDSE